MGIPDGWGVILGVVAGTNRGYVLDMNATYTAITKQENDWWIGWIEEVPGVNAQERTKEKLMRSLKEILIEALEFNRAEAREAASGNYTEESLLV